MAQSVERQSDPMADPVAVPAGKLSVIVTYLEMTERPDRPPGLPPLDAVSLDRVYSPSVPYYRFLYNGTGENWLWIERRRMTDREIRAVIGDSRVEIWVLSHKGAPAGFAELNRIKAPTVELQYFGLMAPYIGLGLGPWMLDCMIGRAWTGHTRRLTVNTCTFDHPKALPLYQRHGFRPIESVVRTIRDPRLSGIVPRTAAPHIPLAVAPAEGT